MFATKARVTHKRILNEKFLFIVFQPHYVHPKKAMKEMRELNVET